MAENLVYVWIISTVFTEGYVQITLSEWWERMSHIGIGCHKRMFSRARIAYLTITTHITTGIITFAFAYAFMVSISIGYVWVIIQLWFNHFIAITLITCLNFGTKFPQAGEDVTSWKPRHRLFRTF